MGENAPPPSNSNIIGKPSDAGSMNSREICKTTTDLQRWTLSLGVLEARGFTKPEGSPVYVSMRLARSKKFMQEGRYLLSKNGQSNCRTSSLHLANSKVIWNEAASWDVLRDAESQLCLRLRVKYEKRCKALQNVFLGEVTLLGEALKPAEEEDKKMSFVYWLPFGAKGAHSFDGSSPTPSCPSSSSGAPMSGINSDDLETSDTQYLRIVMQWGPSSKVADSQSALSKASRADDARAPRKNSFSGFGSYLGQSAKRRINGDESAFGGTRLAQVLADFEQRTSTIGEPKQGSGMEQFSARDPEDAFCTSREYFSPREGPLVQEGDEEDKNEDAKDASTCAPTDKDGVSSGMEDSQVGELSDSGHQYADLSKSIDDIITTRLSAFEDERKLDFEKIVDNMSECSDHTDPYHGFAGGPSSGIDVDFTSQEPDSPEEDSTRSVGEPRPSAKGLGNWQNGEAEAFRCRVGPNYKKNGLKGPSEKALYKCIGVDIIKSLREKHSNIVHRKILKSIEDNVDRYSNDPKGPLPKMIVVNFQVPYEPGPKLFGAHPPDDYGASVVVQFLVEPQTQREAENLEKARPSVKLLHRFFSKQRQDMKQKGNVKEGPSESCIFKCIGVIENLETLAIPSWSLPFVKKFNATPVLIEKELTMLPDSDRDLFELDLDIRGFNAIARQLLSQLRDQLLETVCHIGLLVQGCTDEELPETILGAFYLSYVDLMDCQVIESDGKQGQPAQSSKSEPAKENKTSIKEAFQEKKDDVGQKFKRASQDFSAKVDQAEQRIKEKKEDIEMRFKQASQEISQKKEEAEQRFKEKTEEVKERFKQAQEEFEQGVHELEERFKQASRELVASIKRKGAEVQLGRMRSWSTRSNNSSEGKEKARERARELSGSKERISRDKE